MLKLAFSSTWRFARNRIVLGSLDKCSFGKPHLTCSGSTLTGSGSDLTGSGSDLTGSDIDGNGYGSDLTGSDIDLNGSGSDLTGSDSDYDSSDSPDHHKTTSVDRRLYLSAVQARPLVWELNEWQLSCSQVIFFKYKEDIAFCDLESMTFDDTRGKQLASTYVAILCKLGSITGNILRDESLERLLVVFQRVAGYIEWPQDAVQAAVDLEWVVFTDWHDCYLSYFLDIEILVVDLKLNPDFALQVIQGEVPIDMFSALECESAPWFEMRRRMDRHRLKMVGVKPGPDFDSMIANMTTSPNVVVSFRGCDIFLHPSSFRPVTICQIETRVWLLNEYQVYNNLSSRELGPLRRLLIGLVYKQKKNRVGTSYTSILMKLGCLTWSDPVDEMRERLLVAIQGVLFSDESTVCLWAQAAAVNVVELERATFGSCDRGDYWSYHLKIKRLTVKLKLNHAFTLQIVRTVAPMWFAVYKWKLEELGELLWESLRRDGVVIVGFNHDPKSYTSNGVGEQVFRIGGKDLLLHPAMSRASSPASCVDFAAAIEKQREGEWTFYLHPYPRRYYRRRLGYKLSVAIMLQGVLCRQSTSTNFKKEK